MKNQRFKLKIYDEDTGDILFSSDTPSSEMMLENLGSYERNILKLIKQKEEEDFLNLVDEKYSDQKENKKSIL